MNDKTGFRAWSAAAAQIARRVAWFPLLVLLVHEVGGHVLHAYRHWPPFDIPMHLLGGFAIAYFFSGALAILGKRNLIREPDRLVRLALLLGLTCAAAVFWEFAEWTADHTIGTTCQLGLDDTLSDIAYGIVGGVAFLAFTGSLRRNATQGSRPHIIRDESRRV